MVDTIPELRVEDLSRESGVTVRNIRAYQTRGLLPPPRLRGRLGLYGDQHLSRLRGIARLQARGFSLAAIRELLVAAERGATLEEVLGLPPRTRPRRAPDAERSPEDAWLEELFDGLPSHLPPIAALHLLHPN